MTFDHDFCYFILLFSSLLKKEGREKENDLAKIVIKSHTFLFHPAKCEVPLHHLLHTQPQPLHCTGWNVLVYKKKLFFDFGINKKNTIIQGRFQGGVGGCHHPPESRIPLTTYMPASYLIKNNLNPYQYDRERQQ